MWTRVLAVGTVGAGLMLTGTARADVFSFNAVLASPDTNLATGSPTTGVGNGVNPSWYNGSANPQGGWTVLTASDGIEIGLRAKYRNVNGIIASSTDTYSVLAGGCVTAACTGGGSPKPAAALWNYEFSIDLRPGGVGSLTLADIAANTVLTVTDTEGNTGSVNPLTHWVDDSGFGSGAGGAAGNTSTGKHSPETTADWGAQNSENLGFADSPLAGFFNPNASDTYHIQLQVISNSGAILGTDSIDVVATPEPSAVILLGTMLIGLFVLARRRLIKA